MRDDVDTTDAATAVQIELWRQMTPERRFSLTASFSGTLLAAARAQIAARYPNASSAQRCVMFVTTQYGEELGRAVAIHLGVPYDAPT